MLFLFCLDTNLPGVYYAIDAGLVYIWSVLFLPFAGSTRNGYKAVMKFFINILVDFWGGCGRGIVTISVVFRSYFRVQSNRLGWRSPILSCLRPQIEAVRPIAMFGPS